VSVTIPGKIKRFRRLQRAVASDVLLKVHLPASKLDTKILVIDDSAMVRGQVSRALTAAGFAVLEASDGLDALEKLAANPDAKLIICDVNMPRMNGIEFLEEKKRTGNSAAVVMLTTEGQPELIQKAKLLGARGWVVKPFKSEHLVATAKKLTSVL
jgi:two-component system chemotaxis response regulator CheY